MYGKSARENSKRDHFLNGSHKTLDIGSYVIDKMPRLTKSTAMKTMTMTDAYRNTTGWRIGFNFLWRAVVGKERGEDGGLGWRMGETGVLLER